MPSIFCVLSEQNATTLKCNFERQIKLTFQHMYSGTLEHICVIFVKFK